MDSPLGLSNRITDGGWRPRAVALAGRPRRQRAGRVGPLLQPRELVDVHGLPRAGTQRVDLKLMGLAVHRRCLPFSFAALEHGGIFDEHSRGGGAVWAVGARRQRQRALDRRLRFRITVARIEEAGAAREHYDHGIRAFPNRFQQLEARSLYLSAWLAFPLREQDTARLLSRHASSNGDFEAAGSRSARASR